MLFEAPMVLGRVRWLGRKMVRGSSLATTRTQVRPRILTWDMVEERDLDICFQNSISDGSNEVTSISY